MNIIKNSSVAFAVGVAELTCSRCRRRRKPRAARDLPRGHAALLRLGLRRQPHLAFIEKRMRVPGTIGGGEMRGLTCRASSTGSVDPAASSCKGLLFSIQLTLIAMVGGIALGTLLALMRLSGKHVAGAPAAFYVNTLRSIPLVMVILWFFLLIPLLIGRPMGAELSAIDHLHACSRRRTTREIMRAGIQSVPQGQVYAGYAVGMTYRQSMKLIVLPQAFRNMLPVLLTQTIILFQDTSLVYAIGAYDLLKGFEVAGKNFNRPVETYLVAAVVYFVICFCLSMLVRRLQKQDRHHPLSEARRGSRHMIDIKNVCKWYGSFQVLTDCTPRSRRARWSSSAARRARASRR